MKTEKQTQAEGLVIGAFRLISEASRELTDFELERFIRENKPILGSHGFVAAVGQTIQRAVTIDSE